MTPSPELYVFEDADGHITMLSASEVPHAIERRLWPVNRRASEKLHERCAEASA